MAEQGKSIVDFAKSRLAATLRHADFERSMRQLLADARDALGCVGWIAKGIWFLAFWAFVLYWALYWFKRLWTSL
jgi:hypothetical protein